MSPTKKYYILVVCFLLIHSESRGEWSLFSPDGNIKLKVQSLDNRDPHPFLTLRMTYKAKPVLDNSFLHFDFAESSRICSKLEVIEVVNSSQDSLWQPVWGEREQIRDHYNEMKIKLKEKRAKGCEIHITFRAYDEGIAFHYFIPVQKYMTDFVISCENSIFRFDKDHNAYVTNRAQGLYDKVPISQITEPCERPLVLEMDNGLYLSLLEARLVDYARMKFLADPSYANSLRTRLDGMVKGTCPFSSPWRVILVGESPGDLLENNFLVYNLNPPCAFSDVSWIMPGKVIREVTLTTQGGMACVDFAVKNNLQYVEFDAGWYGHESADSSDATTVTVDPRRSGGPLDLHRVIEYAGEQDIGIFLYVNRRALEKQLDTIFPLYQKWGIKGVKFGFVNVGSQYWTTWLHRAVQKAAEHQLMVDIHDEYRPTGVSRTLPNLMTQEGIRGDETTPVTEQTLLNLFTRMIAGPADHTICYFADRVEQEMADHAFQLAKSIAFFSPLQFVFWYDRPKGSSCETGGLRNKKVIADVPELQFFKKLPTIWDETRLLEGEIGKFAVIARRKNRAWYVGILNCTQKRMIIPLTFLEPSTQYIAYIYYDDPKVATETKIGIKNEFVEKSTVLDIDLRLNSGQAICLEPID